MQPDPIHDRELLRRYDATGDQSAFALLVQRHLGLVYSTARRHLQDVQLCEDASQIVFALLARRARDLKPDVIIPGWLVQTTRFVCLDLLRTRNSQTRVEREAARLKPMIIDPPDNFASDQVILSSRLDEALAELGDIDRNAIILRYFCNESAGRIGAMLGLSEAAAGKRIVRAVHRLRGIMNRHAAQPLSESMLATALTGAITPAPVGLLERVKDLPLHATHRATELARTMPVSSSNGAFVIVKIAAAAAVVALIVLIWPGSTTKQAAAPAAPAAPFTPAATAPVTVFPQAELIHDPALAKYPIANGWPRALPGGIYVTPVAADIDSDGKPEIIVACCNSSDPLVHSNPAQNALLYVLRADGTVMPGWPQELSPIPRNRNGRPPSAGAWGCSPSVAPGPDGKPRIIIGGAYGRGGISIFRGDGTLVKRIRGGADSSSCIPIVDLNDDGTLDIISGPVTATIDGDPIPNWHGVTRRGGYTPAVGDVNGDGKNEFFYLCYTARGANHVDVFGFDHSGKYIPGWKHFIDDPAWNGPVIGDITGDGKKEIVATYGNHLFAWAADGTNLPNTTTERELDGILVSGVSATSSTPALADLDGDGKAEIIFFDQNTRTLRAYHGDGKGYTRADGIIATLPTECGGVSVADLGGDGVWDFFCGTYWVKLDKSGKATSHQHAPDSARNRADAANNRRHRRQRRHPLRHARRPRFSLRDETRDKAGMDAMADGAGKCPAYGSVDAAEIARLRVRRKSDGDVVKERF